MRKINPLCFFVVAASILLSSCSGRYLANSKGLGSLDKDRSACEAASNAYVEPTLTFEGSELIRYGDEKGEVYRRCMADRGYFYYSK